MKISLSHAQPQRGGFALILVLILLGISLAIVASDLQRTQSVAIVNQRNNEFSIDCNAAESAVEKVFARMAYDYQSYGVAYVVSATTAGSYQTNIPNATDDAYWSQFSFSDANGNTNKICVFQVGTYGGPLPSAYTGLYCTTNSPIYEIVSNAQLTQSTTGVIGTCQEYVLLALVPLNTWAIFYNGLMEFTQCATMIVNGRVQANGSIYVGTTDSLTFNSGVSCTATLTAPFVDGLSSGWTVGTPSTWNTTFNATPSYTTNVASVTVSLNTTNSHFMIDIPPAGESPTSTTGQQRLYNQAQMILIVTNSAGTNPNPTVLLTLQQSVNGAVPGTDPAPEVLTYTNASPGSLSTNLPFLSLTNMTYDQREQKTNLLTQVDVGSLANWIAQSNSPVQSKLPASAGQYPTIFYVADRRNASATQLPSVRLANGAQLPANNNLGFTVATPNPLYVQGNYNVQTASSAANASAASTNTAYTVPAALFSDSLTVLSPNWTDSQSYSTYHEGTASMEAANDTINAAIVTGTVPSTGITGTTFSGGVHNLPRLLEDWSTPSANLYLNTSILRLWDSNMATNMFRNPSGFSPSPVNPYYNPPTRHYTFDPNFLNPAKVPPGIPVALVPIRFAWGVPPPGVTNYVPLHD
jgi:hypothetical protein